MKQSKIKRMVDIKNELATHLESPHLKLLLELEELIQEEGYMDAMYEIEGLFDIETRGLSHYGMVCHIYTSIENHLIHEVGINFVKTSWEGVSDCNECGEQTKEKE